MFQIRNKNFLFKNIFRNQNIFLWRHKKTPKAKVDFRGLNVHSEKISAWRTKPSILECFTAPQSIEMSRFCFLHRPKIRRRNENRRIVFASNLRYAPAVCCKVFKNTLYGYSVRLSVHWELLLGLQYHSYAIDTALCSTSIPLCAF